MSGRRTAHRLNNRISKRSGEETDRDQKAAEASLADEEEDEEAQEADSAIEADDEDEDEDAAETDSEFSTETDEDFDDDTSFGEDADEDGADEESADDADTDADDEGDDNDDYETRADDVDKRSSLEVEIDPFVRAYGARRAAEKGDESLDEYIVGSVKGYLAGLLGGDVSSPGTLEREVDLEADDIFGGLLETIAEDDESAEDVVINAVAEAYDVPVEEDSLVVAGLRDHEALLNGVVANSSNDLDNVSDVVQAAVETRLIEEPA